MPRPMFVTYEAQARFDAEEVGLDTDGRRVMELVGQIADGDPSYGPVGTKIQLIAHLLKRREA